MEDFVRWFLPLYLFTFLAIAFVWRSLKVKKLTGVNPYVLGKTDKAHDFIGVVFRIVVLLIFVAVTLNALSEDLYKSIGPLVWLESDWIRYFSTGVLSVALVWVAVAQMQMGKSWRIGIDKENRTDLVETGVFAVSRNPIFLGMRVMLLGLFLMIPNSLTLLTWILGDVLMQIQVRLEEEFLSDVHGERYLGYKSKVRRWI